MAIKGAMMPSPLIPWLSDTPTQTGFYWFQATPKHEVELVRVEEVEGELRVADYYREGPPLKPMAEVAGRYAGPLPFPKWADEDI